MALSGELGKANLKPDSIETKAAVTFEKLDVGFTITRIHLEVVGQDPGRHARGVPQGRRRRQAQLPDLAPAEHHHHARSQAGLDVGLDVGSTRAAHRRFLVSRR